MKRATLVVVALAGAVAAGRLTVSTPEPTHTERVIEHRSVEPRIVQTRDGLSADEIRDIVRSELAHPVAQPPAPVELDEAAFTRARSAVDQGTADGKWTAEDRDQLRAAIPGLTQAQLDELVPALFVKINSGTLRVELVGPPV